MSLSNQIKIGINAGLSLVGLELITQKKGKAEVKRLQDLETDHFERQVFPILQAYQRCDPTKIFSEVNQQKEFWSEVVHEKQKEFQIENDYFTSPDAEVLTAMVGLWKPGRIIEIGSGNSTRLFRIASDQFQAQTKIISIDPFPRVEIENYAHSILRQKLEDVETEWFHKQIESGDLLFIDSTHEIKTGNDVVELFLNILPRLKPGVLIHIHDIFLPYEYPKEWIMQNRWPWNEQYLVQALLQGSEEYEVLWAGHYHQKTMPDFAKHFPLWQGKDASSLWLKKIRSDS